GSDRLQVGGGAVLRTGDEGPTVHPHHSGQRPVRILRPEHVHPSVLVARTVDHIDAGVHPGRRFHLPSGRVIPVEGGQVPQQQRGGPVAHLEGDHHDQRQHQDAGHQPDPYLQQPAGPAPGRAGVASLRTRRPSPAPRCLYPFCHQTLPVLRPPPAQAAASSARTAGSTAEPRSWMPPAPVRPCGVPNSTRSAPAAASPSVCSTTWLGVPARQNRSSRSSLSSPPASSARPSASSARNRTSSSSSTCTVGSRRATTSTYMATSRRASARARSPSSSTTVTAPAHTRTAAVPRPAAVADVSTQVRICWTMSGLADPPIFTSSAICPASAAPRGPQTPSSTCTAG